METKNRKTIRLKNYDYSLPGYYFVAICSQDRKCYFGEIVNGEMILNEYGNVVKNCWKDLPNHYRNCELDTFIIMPNHIHGTVP